MALNAYTIYSDNGENLGYNDEGQLQGGSGLQNPNEERSQRVHVHFVPARGGYDEFGRPTDITQFSRDAKEPEDGGVGDWYLSLQRSQATKSTIRRPVDSKLKGKSRLTSSKEESMDSNGSETPIKPNWFQSSSNLTLAERDQSSSLAEMLRRDPPNPENPLVPPVYYAIGPTNKGYEMLTKGGWEEGQPLGPQSSMKGSSSDIGSSANSLQTRPVKKKEKWSTLYGSMPKLLVPKASGTGIDIVDISREVEESESSSSEDDGTRMFAPTTGDKSTPSTGSLPAFRGSRKVDAPILTPIAVALKNDRAGLGAEKRKRLVTHSALAIQHHMQQGQTNHRNHISEMRRMERGHLRGKYGRGKRAYARKAKDEEEKRNRLREYMNS
ncbi:hypothetical protein FRC14_003351 [Serendipita sp. 396]|nr:hypothetical protein FRC14_003351 [Serendipita sp. 396]KAG8825821.1 hypothetical protein FRC19_010374 [Serendipita sp. 401]KAG8836136.1 hypothetical protein FRC18_011788 [Serendipita sp. 400]